MSQEDNLSKLFRKSQHKLDEMPSSAAWRRLERRLDDRHQQPSLGWYKYAAVAVILVSLIASISLLTPKNNSPEKLPLAEVNKMEQLEKVQESNNQKNNEVTNAVTNDKPITDELAKNEKTAITPPPIVEKQFTNDNPKANVIINPPPVVEEELTKIIPMDTEGTYPEDPLEIESDPEVDPTIAEVAPEEIEETEKSFFSYDDDVNTVETEDLTLVKDGKTSTSVQAAPAKKSKTIERKELDFNSYKSRKRASASNKKGIDVRKKKKKNRFHPINNQLKKFLWLVGEWKDDSLEGESYENWIVVNKYTIEGSGYLIVEQDTIFTEKITIQYSSNQMYYIVQVDNLNRRLQYRLTSFKKNEAIFEQNSNKEFPNQVILRLKKDHYQTEINNTSSPLSTDQSIYLKSRNHLSKERATRSMKRIF